MTDLTIKPELLLHGVYGSKIWLELCCAPYRQKEVGQEGEKTTVYLQHMPRECESPSYQECQLESNQPISIQQHSQQTAGAFRK